jgi:hypothetical protein
MSKTGYFYAEIWKNSQWEAIPFPNLLKGKRIPVRCIDVGTPYELYAALVGYEHCTTYPMYHTEPIVPLSAPRGFPVDMNALYKQHFETNLQWKRYLTWFLVHEVMDYPWDREFPPFVGYVKTEYAGLFIGGAFPEEFPEGEGIWCRGGESLTEVSWVESYREFVGCGDWFIGELMELGDPRDVRVLFWLDY